MDEKTIDGVDEEALTPVVQRVLDDTTARLRTWRIDPVDYRNFSEQRALYRAHGTADLRGRTRRWSAILKSFKLVANDQDPVQDPRHYTYWKREADLYASGLLDGLPPRFAAPRYLGGQEEPNRVLVWLEDLFTSQPRWPLAPYRAAARALGEFNGASLVGRVPDLPWLASPASVLSYYGSTKPELQPAFDFLAQPERWSDPRIVAVLGEPLRLDLVREIYAEEARWIERLGRLPHVFCHNDAFRDNLYARRRGGHQQTAAFDWQLAGLNALGTEVGLLVGGSILFVGYPAERAADLEGAAMEEYLGGLREVGLRPDEEQVRLAYLASAVLRLGMITAAWLAWSLDEPEFVSEFWRRPAEESTRTFAGVAAFLATCAERALEVVS